MNMEIILHYCSPPLASVWWGGGASTPVPLDCQHCSLQLPLVCQL